MPTSRLTKVLYQAVVVDVFSNPSQLSEKQKNILKGKVANTDYTSKMPRNSIAAVILDSDGTAILDSQSVILYPFFSGHLSMPIKPGERVFVMYENAQSPDKSVGNGVLGYWITRVPANIDIDDINYTCMERTPPIVTKTDNMNAFEGTTPEGIPSFPNGPGSVEQQIFKNKSGFDDIVMSAYAFRNAADTPEDWEAKVDQASPLTAAEFTGEPIPRYSKTCSDLCIQGSNNTLIALTEDPATRKAGSSESGSIDGAGTIDIVAGRGFGALNAVVPITNTRDYDETDKKVDVATKTEGEIDFITDLSRVYVSMKASPDTDFGLIYSHTTATAAVEVPSIVIKSDEIRLVARETGSVRLVKEGGLCEISMLADNTIAMDASKIYLGHNGFITGGLEGQPVMRGELLEAALHDLANAINAAVGGAANAFGLPLLTAGAAATAITLFKADVTSALSETVFVK
tara:strand:+ start:1220 stop:2596 length:1377 start_codon:yes stop_codon:yes gene_type:complete